MTPSLSESLKHETAALHRLAEGSAFMRLLLGGRMQRPDYCAMLRNLHAIYEALEPALRRHAGDPLLAPLFLPALWREAALRRDLDALHGADWRASFALQPATPEYVARLRQIDAADPPLLAAHSYVRYLGDLSGGQMLARIVRGSMRPAPGVGTAFYDFGDVAETARLKQAFRKGLDALPAGPAHAQAIVAEAKFAFELHRQLFDQLARGLDANP